MKEFHENVSCFVMYDIYLRVHFQTAGQLMHWYVVYMFSENVDRDYGAIPHLNNSPFETIDQ